ncbi:MAG: substrate-binding domain-containing protein [Lachnospiraceae bacterium]|nr:substrate-binding domain-containing protein [Lachnospiraceae bacterium]
MKKKLISLAMVMVMSASLLAGCGQGGNSAGSGSVKLFVSYSQDTFRNAFASAAVEEAKAQGVDVATGPDDSTVEKQVESIKKAVSEGCTAILCIPVNSATAQQLEVAAGGVPIIFCNSMPDESYMKANKYIYVGSSEEEAGRFQAEKLLSMYPDKKEFNIVMLKGEKDHSGTVGRQAGFVNHMKDSGIKVNYVFNDYGNWQGEIAVSKFEQFLKTGQAYDAVVCHNDTMAVAVADYMISKGINTSEKPVLGIDATAEGLASLENGGISFTVYQSAKGQGIAAVNAGILLSKGSSVETIEGVDKENLHVYVPFEAVSKENAAQYK